MTSERREREGDGGSGRECLERRAREIGAGSELPRRYEELLDWAVDALGLERGWAERAYDIAREERLEPAIAFDLIRCGVGIRAEAANGTDAPMLDPDTPSWLRERPDPAEAWREWRLRASLRRLRSLLEEGRAPGDALVSFANAPDVDDAGY